MYSYAPFCPGVQTKAFDNKTSVLHCVVRAIQASDPESLHLDAELGAVAAAGRVPLDSVMADMRQLKSQVAACHDFLAGLTARGSSYASDMDAFLAEAQVSCGCASAPVQWLAQTASSMTLFIQA